MNFWEWIDETKAWHWFAKHVLSGISLRIFPRKKPTEEQKSQLIKTILEAPSYQVICFVAQNKWSIGSILIRLVSNGKWTHAGFVSKTLSRIDVRSDGIHISDVRNLLNEYDSVALVAFNLNEKSYFDYQKKLYGYVVNSDRIQYDWEQELKDDTSDPEVNDIYCSELVWLVLKGLCKLQCSTVLGRNAFTPNDVAKSGRIIWSYP